MQIGKSGKLAASQVKVGVLLLSGVVLVRLEGVSGGVVSALPQTEPPRTSAKDIKIIRSDFFLLASLL
jgi:hypothetical protein